MVSKWLAIGIVPRAWLMQSVFVTPGNREAKRELKVYNNDKPLPFCPTPTYLGGKLDRLLMFCHHLVALCKKLSLRVSQWRRLVSLGSGWGDGVLVPKYYAQLPYPWSTQQVSTVHQSGVTALTLASLTVF